MFGSLEISCSFFFLSRNCVLHLAALHQEGLISGETASNCILILQVRAFLCSLLTFDFDLQETVRKAPNAMVESWVEGRQRVLEQQQEVFEVGKSEHLKTPEKRCRGGLCEEDFETMQANQIKAWSDLSDQGLEMLTDQGLEVLTYQGLEVLTDQGLEVLTDLGLEVLPNKGLKVLTELGLSNSEKEDVVSGEGEGGNCDLGEEGLEGVKELGEGGQEGLKVPTEELNPTQDCGEVVLTGEGGGLKRDVVELYTILDGVGDGGEIEMFHISELKDDSLGEEHEVEIVIRNESEGKQAEEKLDFIEVEPKDNIVCAASCKSVIRKRKRSVTKREFFLRLRK